MSEPVRVVCVGLGGVGSWTADGFGRVLNVNAPGSQLILVDGDVFEPKNVERQNFTTYGNKARSVAKDLIEKLPNVLISPMAAWVVADDATGSDDDVGVISATELLKDGDVLFMCVDNHSARKLLLEAAQKLDNVTVLNGGNEDDGFGSTYVYVRRNGVDITHYPGIYYNEFVTPPDKNPGEMSCAERAELEGGTQVIATNLAVASTMIFDAHKLLFADDASGIEGNRKNFAGVILTNDKMFDLGYGTSVSWARVDEDVFNEMCSLNEDVAEICHNKVVSLVATASV